MKRISLVLMILAAAFMLFGCPPKPKPTNTETPPVQPPTEQPKEDIKPPVVDDKPMISESQFQTVYFDFDKYNLRSDGKSALDANAGLLKQFPDVIVRIEGHCDERGTVEYNLSLGEKRARACMEYLNGLGIAANRVSVISYGEERPAVSGSDESAWSQNRRCEFKIISK
ncbi:MAG: peptidoglycan-associated lipoprotein Pal [bacterium]|nr:peptidoglycan-associated lipoprotein Pal [bacterium]